MNKFNYILNDLALSNLITKCLYSENASYSDKEELENQIKLIQQENKHLKDKLSKIETLVINHNCDTGDIYYKYNSKFLKSELKQRILEIVYEQGSDKK